MKIGPKAEIREVPQSLAGCEHCCALFGIEAVRPLG
jgi:hypothetical protein